MSTIVPDPIVRNVTTTYSHVPSTILATSRQLQDLARFCNTSPTHDSTFIGFDKTFNLSELHVTASVYKNLAVKRITTNDHPIFLGPCFLHGNSDFETYNTYFNYLSLHLSSPIIGSDGEGGLVKAIRHSFPTSHHLTCTRHLRTNAMDQLKDKIGLPHQARQLLLSHIFGDDGITATTNQLAFEHRLQQTTDHITAVAPAFIAYFNQRIVPGLRNNLAAQHAHASSTRPSFTKWTNNNCESINNVLKTQLDWKAQNPMDLVDSLHQLITRQHKQVERAIVGQGDFYLTKPYQKYKITINAWASLTDDQRSRHLDKFYRAAAVTDPRMVISSDGHAVIAPQHGGRKPHQVKRPRAERATTVLKKRKV